MFSYVFVCLWKLMADICVGNLLVPSVCW